MRLRLTKIFENVSDSIIVLDEDFNITRNYGIGYILMVMKNPTHNRNVIYFGKIDIKNKNLTDAYRIEYGIMDNTFSYTECAIVYGVMLDWEKWFGIDLERYELLKRCKSTVTSHMLWRVPKSSVT